MPASQAGRRGFESHLPLQKPFQYLRVRCSPSVGRNQVTPEDSIRLSAGEQQVWADTITWGGQLFVFEDNDLCGSAKAVARLRGPVAAYAASPRDRRGIRQCAHQYFSFTTFTSSKLTSTRFAPTHVSPIRPQSVECRCSAPRPIASSAERTEPRGAPPGRRRRC